jgi:hypothetical protein
MRLMRLVRIGTRDFAKEILTSKDIENLKDTETRNCSVYWIETQEETEETLAVQFRLSCAVINK